MDAAIVKRLSAAVPNHIPRMTAPSSEELISSPVRRSVRAFRPYFQHVTIHEGAIEDLANDLASESFTLPQWDFGCHIEPSAPTEDVLDYLFIANSLNFAFRDFDSGEKYAVEYDGDEWRGASGLMAALSRAYDRGEPVLEGSYLADLSRSDVEVLFEPSNDVEIPLLGERHRILNEVGEQLVDQYDGRFHTFIDAAEPRLYANGDGIVDRLVAEFPSYADTAKVVTETGPLEVTFQKRAQLAVAMALGRLGPTGEFHLQDPGAFTLFADYNMPNIFRHYDVLEYDAALAATVDNEELLEAGSREEVEIRAATIAAADDLLVELNQRRESDELVTGAHLDAKLFLMRDDVASPVHRTRTTAY